jgi:type VI secretion system protein ImpJ
MAFTNKIVWSEGMFLQPQHFQQQDRYIENLIVEHAATVEAYGWGLTGLKINEALLKLGKFSLDSCQGILPDGTLFSIPARDQAPLALEVPIGISNCLVYLAITSKRAGMPEVNLRQNSTQDTYRYHADTIETMDSNAGTDIAIPLQIGKLLLRLLLEHEDRQGFSCLGIARIIESRADHQIIIDDQYLPPCLNIHGLQRLRNLLQEIQGLLHYRGNMLMQRLTDSGSEGIAEIADFMLLQLINRFEPLFVHLSNIRSLHPEALYCFLLQLAGELATFTSWQRRPTLVANYLHDDLQISFDPLITELRKSLSVVLEESAVSIKVEQQQFSTWVAMLKDKSLLHKATFVLAVHATVTQETIRTLFPTQTKIAPVEEIRNLVNRALPAIELNPLSVAPRQIPYHANFVYFSLNHHHALWQELEKSAGLAFHVGGDFPGLRLELWAVKDKRYD